LIELGYTASGRRFGKLLGGLEDRKLVGAGMGKTGKKKMIYVNIIIQP